MNASAPRALLYLAVIAVALAARPALAQEPKPLRASGEVVRQLEQVEKQLQNADENIRFVETQFTQRPEPSDEEAKRRRFSDGEIQYLLGDWTAASVLFYDLVSDPRFQGNPRYPDALFYLSDSLLQQQNYIGARLYLRELLALPPTGALQGRAVALPARWPAGSSSSTTSTRTSIRPASCPAASCRPSWPTSTPSGSSSART